MNSLNKAIPIMTLDFFSVSVQPCLKDQKYDKLVKTIFQFLRNYAKPLKPFLLGKKSITERIKIFKYKYLTHQNQSVEIVTTDSIEEDFYVVNGTIVKSLYANNWKFVSNIDFSWRSKR